MYLTMGQCACNNFPMSRQYNELTQETKDKQQLRVALYKQAQQILVTAYKDDFNTIYRTLCKENGLDTYVKKTTLVEKYLPKKEQE